MLGGIPGTLCIALASYVALGAAQAFHGFNWMIKLSGTSQFSFQECQNVPLAIIPLLDGTFFGVPPYYMLAFESGGIPTTTAVGSDRSNLLWKASHKQGTVLMLTMVDSKNQTGGIPSTQYTIQSEYDAYLTQWRTRHKDLAPASRSSCLPAAPQDVPVITPNVTESLSTCEPWGLKITGGKKPYTIVLTAFNSTTMTNVTMRPTDDTYVYINRADPGSPLMASVADVDGNWGQSTPFVNTTGSTDTTCMGVESTPSDSSGPNGPPDTSHTTSHAKATKGSLIAGLVSGILLITAFGVCVWLWHRRQRKSVHSSDNDMILAGIWDENTTEVPMMDQTEWSPTSLITGDASQVSSLQQVHVVQHHDAEVVRELPPPYAEGAARASHPPALTPREKVPEVTLRLVVVGGAEMDMMSAGAGPSNEILGR